MNPYGPAMERVGGQKLVSPGVNPTKTPVGKLAIVSGSDQRARISEQLVSEGAVVRAKVT